MTTNFINVFPDYLNNAVTNIGFCNDSDILPISRSGTVYNVELINLSPFVVESGRDSTQTNGYAIKNLRGAGGASNAGDPAGYGSVDLQMMRSDADQTANGFGGFIGAGEGCKIGYEAALSVVCGGLHCTTEGKESVIGGGGINNINAGGIYGFIGGGALNVLSGLYSSIPGGISNNAESDYTCVLGSWGKAHLYGSLVYSMHPFTNLTDQNQMMFSNAIFVTTGNTSGALACMVDVPYSYHAVTRELLSGVTSSGTTFMVTKTTAQPNFENPWPITKDFSILIGSEKVIVTNLDESSSLFSTATVTRGRYGTSAAVHASGDSISFDKMSPEYFSVPDGRIWWFDGSLQGIQRGFPSNFYQADIKGGVKNISGVVSLIGTPTITIHPGSNSPTMSGLIGTSGTNMVINVIDASGASRTVNWSAWIRINELSGRDESA